MILRDHALKSFVQDGINRFPHEAVGFIVIVNGKQRYIPVANVADNPAETFLTDDNAYADVEDEHGPIVALAHTHPNGKPGPSMADRTVCSQGDIPWFIASISDQDGEPALFGEVSTLLPEEYEAPLTGREFVHGIHDCYTILLDWFKREKNIQLKDYKRWDDWWNADANLYLENYADTGFNRVSGEPRIGDVFLMQIRANVPNHAAIYIGNGEILHHMYGRLSTTATYGGYWQEVTVVHLRHEELPND